jgi:hypothetical protein
MQKLKIKFENCYGIRKLEDEFDFSKCNTVAIYAPNGVMKTSFAKTFTDYVNKIESKDQVFKREPYERKIIDENDVDIDIDNIFIIKSFIDTGYVSEKISTLLVRNELREKYEKALMSLDEGKKAVISFLKTSTISSDCEKEMLRTFSDLGDNIFEILNNLTEDISKNTFREYNFKYNDVFDNPIVRKFVNKNKNNLQMYHDKYFEILGNSDDFFSHDGTFGTAQASKIAEAVVGDAFFNAGHKISLKSSKPISSSKDLNDLINEQIDKVLNSPELRKQFDKIDKDLRPKNIQPLKNIIEVDKSLLLELLNYEEFQKNYWKSHLSQIKTELDTLNQLFIDKKGEIEEIIREANTESDVWKLTLETFKGRFINLPFEIEIENTKDSVLGLKQPSLCVRFIDRETGESELVERDFISDKVLSQGERRAFYLLNIIFEIQARLIKNQETIFVIDDIADSFDYKNKYAIVEYLNDLHKNSNFYSIILTHNFDFYRIITSRLGLVRGNKKHAIKTVDRISIIEEVYQKPPFITWMNYLKSGKNFTADDAKKHILALIPFVRNLIEYGHDSLSSTSYGDDFSVLTSLLHSKAETAKITFCDLKLIFRAHISRDDFDISILDGDIVYDHILTVASSIQDEEFNLENKIILAMAIRHKAEEYMWQKVTNQSEIVGNQTRELYERYQDDCIHNADLRGALSTLERVNIMTPENIHLNSFMYEPILDMGIGELKGLYSDIYLLDT